MATFVQSFPHPLRVHPDPTGWYSPINREAFIKSSFLTMKIFLNSAGLLHIVNDATPMIKHSKNRQVEEADVSDPLDNSRIHPEDYELGRKVATNALEFDEEDIHDEHHRTSY